MGDHIILDRVYESTIERLERKRVKTEKVNAALIASDQMPGVHDNSLSDLVENRSEMATPVNSTTGNLHTIQIGDILYKFNRNFLNRAIC